MPRQPHIFQRTADGLWCAKVTVGGKAFTRYAATPEQAEVALRELVYLRDQRRLKHTPRQTLRDYLDHWLTDVKYPTLRPATHRGYLDRMERVCAHIGGLQLDTLRLGHIQECYSAMLREGLAPGTLRITHSTLHSALDHAVATELLDRNPADHAILAPVPHIERGWLSVEQVIQVYEANVDDRLRFLWLFLPCTGLRIGEALALTWDNLTRGSVQVRQTITRDAGNHISTGPVKTKNARRDVPLMRTLAGPLAAHRARVRAEQLRATRWADHNLVFPSRHGQYQHQSTVRDDWARALNRAGIPPVRLHDLRRTHASLQYLAGTGDMELQQIMGHSDIAITKRTYISFAESRKAEAMERVDALFDAAWERAT